MTTHLPSVFVASVGGVMMKSTLPGCPTTCSVCSVPVSVSSWKSHDLCFLSPSIGLLDKKSIESGMTGYIVFDSWPSKLFQKDQQTSSLLLAMEGVLSAFFGKLCCC